MKYIIKTVVLIILCTAYQKNIINASQKPLDYATSPLPIKNFCKNKKNSIEGIHPDALKALVAVPNIIAFDQYYMDRGRVDWQSHKEYGAELLATIVLASRHHKHSALHYKLITEQLLKDGANPDALILMNDTWISPLRMLKKNDFGFFHELFTQHFSSKKNKQTPLSPEDINSEDELWLSTHENNPSNNYLIQKFLFEKKREEESTVETALTASLKDAIEQCDYQKLSAILEKGARTNYDALEKSLNNEHGDHNFFIMIFKKYQKNSKNEPVLFNMAKKLIEYGGDAASAYSHTSFCQYRFHIFVEKIKAHYELERDLTTIHFDNIHDEV